jgi:hypothetical protein
VPKSPVKESFRLHRPDRSKDASQSSEFVIPTRAQILEAQTIAVFSAHPLLHGQRRGDATPLAVTNTTTPLMRPFPEFETIPIQWRTTAMKIVIAGDEKWHSLGVRIGEISLLDKIREAHHPGLLDIGQRFANPTMLERLLDGHSGGGILREQSLNKVDA